jgi:hypothetical protein
MHGCGPFSVYILLDKSADTDPLPDINALGVLLARLLSVFVLFCFVLFTKWEEDLKTTHHKLPPCYVCL